MAKQDVTSLLKDVAKLKTKPDADANKRISETEIVQSNFLDSALESITEKEETSEVEINWDKINNDIPVDQITEVVEINIDDNESVNLDSLMNDIQVRVQEREAQETRTEDKLKTSTTQIISFGDDLEPSFEQEQTQEQQEPEQQDTKQQETKQQETHNSTVREIVFEEEVVEPEVVEPEVVEPEVVGEVEPEENDQPLVITEAIMTKHTGSYQIKDVIKDIEHSAELEIGGLNNLLEQIKTAYSEVPITKVVELQEPRINEELIEREIAKRENDIIKQHEEKRSKEISESLANKIKTAN